MKQLSLTTARSAIVLCLAPVGHRTVDSRKSSNSTHLTLRSVDIFFPAHCRHILPDAQWAGGLTGGFDLSSTWAEWVAGQLLDALTLADGTTVERGGIRAAASAFLVATPTATVAHRPLGPGGPATVDWNTIKETRRKKGR